MNIYKFSSLKTADKKLKITWFAGVVVAQSSPLNIPFTHNTPFNTHMYQYIISNTVGKFPCIHVM